MFENNSSNKILNITKFLLSPLKVIGGGFLISIAALLTLYVAGYNSSGKWTVGTSLVDWWSTVSSSAPIDGKFSAVDMNACWSCNIFAKTIDLMSVMGSKIYVYIADIAWTLIVMGFAVWLVNYMYNNLIKNQSSDISKMAKEITKKIIVISVIGVGLFFTTDKKENEQYLVSMANTVFENTATPLLEFGIGVGTKIINTDICSHLSYPKSEVDGLISSELKEDMLCLVNSVNMMYLSAMTAGSNMISMSWKSDKIAGLPDIIAGMAIISIFFLMYLTIPFTLIDIVFTLGILVCFIPLMIGGYAYDKTKNFSNMGIQSLIGMAFYIIIYCVFIGILYSSFVYIADMYYPAPLDNFTYLFPDFIYKDIVGNVNETMQAAFNACVSNNDSIGKIQKCLLKSGIELNMPTLSDPGGSFLPMFSLGMVSLMIMGSVKTYSKLISGYMFTIGNEALKLVKSTIGVVKNVGRDAIGFIQEAKEDNAKLDANKIEDEQK